MTLTPVYEPFNPVTCIAGDATESTCKVVIMSMNDPAVDDVSFFCNGTKYTHSGGDFTMTAVGTDSGAGGVQAQAGWLAVLTVTGLPTTFQRFNWSVVQGIYSDSGSFTNRPASSDDFVLFSASCDNNTNYTNQNNGNPHTVVGYYKRMKELCQSGNEPECAGILHIDDIFGYVDAKSVDDSDSSGHVSTGSPQTTYKEYDYFLAWFSAFGMLGENVDTASTANGDLSRIWGRETNRAWCRKNMNMRVGFGDHEFGSDFGWDIDVATAPGPFHKVVDGDFLGGGYVAWQAIWGAINPDAIAGASDTDASHWSVDIGCVTVATLDGITNNSTTGTILYGASPTALTSVYGSGQIDDVLGDFNTERTPFKMLLSPNGMAYVGNGVDVSENGTGSQHPIYDHCIAEYKQLFTADNNAGNPSIMDGSYTNGAYGTTVVLFGDLHVGSVQRHHSGADTNVLQEELYEIHLGTINGSINHTQASQIVEGYEYVNGGQKITIEYQMDVNQIYGDRTFQGTRFICYGSRSYPEMELVIEDAENNVKYNKKFVQYSGNAPKDTTYTSNKTATGSGI